MSNEELVKLIKNRDDSGKAMEQLYINNKPYIYSIARKYSNMAETEDLMQEAYFGLRQAVNNYVSDKEVKFISYATYWIKQAILRYIENTRQLVRIPTYLHSKIFKFNRCTQYINAMYNRQPEVKEYLDMAGIEANEVKIINNVIYNSTVKSLDEILIKEENITLSDTIADTTNVEDTIIENMSQQELSNTLWSVVKEILNNEDYYSAIEAVYRRKLTLVAHSKEKKVSRERIRQRQARALRILRHNKHIKKIAEDYEFITDKAYNSSYGSFKNHRISSTEYVALKHINIELDMIRFYIYMGVEDLLTEKQRAFAIKNGLLKSKSDISDTIKEQ